MPVRVVELISACARARLRRRAEELLAGTRCPLHGKVEWRVEVVGGAWSRGDLEDHHFVIEACCDRAAAMGCAALQPDECRNRREE